MELFGLGAGDIALGLVLGGIVGFFIGLTGVGGGVLGLQAMTLVLRMDPISAVGTTGLYTFLTKISASVQHARLGNIDWKAAAHLLVGAIPANIITSQWISGQGGNAGFMDALQLFIIYVILFSAAVLVVDTAKSLHRKAECRERRVALKMEGHGILKHTSSILLGALIGGLVGATSMGGGVLLVPMLITIFGLSARQTVGTSIFVAMTLTLAMVLIYGKSGEVAVPTAVIMAFGSLPGIRSGSRLSVKLPEQGLRWAMVGLILTAALAMMLSRPAEGYS
jgi:uncharacterized membrane protein YfcA